MMKSFFTFLCLTISCIVYPQTTTTPILGFSHRVTTILDTPDAAIDDALAFDSQGNLYGSNFSGDTVYKITPSGEVSAFVTGLQNPNGLAFDSRDNLFVVEYSGASIHKYDIDGNLLQTFPVGDFPSGLIKAFRGDTMIFTNVSSTSENNSIRELLPDGSINVLVQGAPLNIPVGLTYDNRGTLYIGNFSDRTIYSLPRRANELEYVATVPDAGTDAPFLAFITYSRGRLYGTNYGEHKIYEINPRNIDDVEIFAGSTFGATDGDISEATFAYPGGIIVDRKGAFYISEFSGVGNIRKIKKSKRRNDVKIDLTAYPNPANELLNINITLPETGSFDIKMYDLFGNITYESTEVSSSTNLLKTITINGWKTGLYTLKISKDNKNTYEMIVIR